MDKSSSMPINSSTLNDKDTSKCLPALHETKIRTHEIYYFVRPFLSHYYYILIFLIYVQELPKRILKKYASFVLLLLLLIGLVVMASTISCLFIMQMIHTKVIKIDLQLLKGRYKGTTGDDVRQPLTRGQLSGSATGVNVTGRP